MSAISRWFVGKAANLYLKTNGWKTIIGWIVVKVVAFIATQYPEVPQEALVEVLNWLGELLLGLGVLDRVRKNIFTK